MDHLQAVIYGTGRVAVHFLRDLKAHGVAVSGCITSTQERAREFQAAHGVACFTSLDQLLASQPRPNLALVVNANHLHSASCIEALGHDMHVYCEKPMASTLAECQAMVDAAARSKGSLQIGFEYIHSTMPARLTELQREGFFGEVLSVSCTDSRGHWWSGDPNAPFEQQVKLRRELGGGIIFHCGIHQLDMIRSYLGPIEEVQAFRAYRNALPFYPDDVPDHVYLIMRARTGAVASLEIFHSRAPTYYRKVPPWQPDWQKTPGHEFRLSMVGTEGSALADFYGEILHLFRFNHAQKDTELVRSEHYGFRPQAENHHDMSGFLARFLSNVASGRGALVPATESLETMKLAFAAERSVVERQPIRPDQLT